jgi:hypothetical protein
VRRSGGWRVEVAIQSGVFTYRGANNTRFEHKRQRMGILEGSGVHATHSLTTIQNQNQESKCIVLTKVKPP